MLSNEALNSAMPLTDVLDSRGLKMVPIPGTPLERLVQATRSDDNFVIMGEDGSVMPSISDIAYIANCKDDVLGGSPHDMAFDNIVEPCVAAVQEHMTFARTVVGPAVQELVEGTVARLEALTPSVLLGMEVITYNPPAPILNNGIEGLIERFSDAPFDNPVMSMHCPSLTVAEIVELMKTGASSMDRDIEAWAAAIGESCIIKIWENVFQVKQAGLNDRSVVTFRDFMEDRDCGVDNALIVFLLARRLFDDVLPGTEMDKRAYSDMMAGFRNQAAGRLSRAVAELEKIGKTKTIVRSVSGTKCVVYGFTYDQWMKDGGSNEILFGNMLELPYAATADNLTSKAEALKAKWARHSAMTATVESNRKFLRTKDALVAAFEKNIREAGDGFLEEASIGNRETVIKRFNEMVDEITVHDVKDLWSLALKLVCRSRFARTDAERILAGIERVKRENPEIDVREAAAVSVIEYIAYWVSSQCKVEAVI